MAPTAGARSLAVMVVMVVVGRAAAGCHLAGGSCVRDGHCQEFLHYLTCIASDKKVLGIDGTGMCEDYGSTYNSVISQCPNW